MFHDVVDALKGQYRLIVQVYKVLLLDGRMLQLGKPLSQTK